MPPPLKNLWLNETSVSRNYLTSARGTQRKLCKFKFSSKTPKYWIVPVPLNQKYKAVKRIVIEGLTTNGRKFRPSDWAERMSGMLSTFGRDQRIRYSPLLYPMTVNGVKCVSIDPDLQKFHPEMYAYILQWADSNRLNVVEIEEEGPLAAAG